MKFLLLLSALAFFVGCNTNNNDSMVNSNSKYDAIGDSDYSKKIIKNNNLTEGHDSNDVKSTETTKDTDKNFVTQIKNIASKDFESKLGTFLYNQLNSIVGSKEKLIKIKDIIKTDMISNIYQYHPEKVNYFYGYCKRSLSSSDENNLNQLFKDYLSQAENIKIFLDKGYVKAFHSLPEHLQEDSDLQTKYISFLVKNNKIKSTIEDSLKIENNNKLLYILYKNGGRESIENYLSNDFIDNLDKDNLLQIAKNLGYQENVKIKDSALFEIRNSNIKIPYIQHRYDLFKLLDKDKLYFEPYDRYLGKFYNYESYLEAVINRSNNKNKDIDFLLNNAVSLSQEIKTKLQRMKTN